MQIFRAEVLRKKTLTPGMVRVTLGGNGLSGFSTTGVGDEYVRLFFAAEGRSEPNLPRATGNGWRWEEGVEPAPLGPIPSVTPGRTMVRLISTS